MAKRVDQFRDSVSTYSGTDQSGNWLTDLAGNVTSWAGNAANQVGPALYNTVAPFAQGLTGGMVGQQAARVAPQVAPQVAQAATQSEPFQVDQLMGPGTRRNMAGGAVASLALPLAALEYGYRGVNTGVGGSVLAVGDYAPWNVGLRALSGNDIYANPLYRDGFQWSDVADTYRKVWGNEKPMIGRDGQPVLDKDGRPVMETDAITSGQAISTVVGRTGINLLDSVLPADVQGNIDKFVEEDTARAMLDPNNTRGLLSWASGLHSEFTVTNFTERESAFNQGAGRWISGAADAAVMWWLAPEVIGLKAAGMAGRSLFMRSLDELSDIEKARESIDLHRAWLRGEEGGRKTDFGRLLESLARLDERQIVRHQLAKSSTDAALVARTFGTAKTYDEAADRFLALSGDLQAIDRLFEADKVLGDTMRMNAERLAELAEDIDRFGAIGRNQNNVFFDNFVARYQAQADRITKVMDQAKAENKQLESAIAGLNREAGLPDVVRFGDVSLSRLRFGPNSAARMEAKAVREAERSAGTHLWKTEEFKTGGRFGRTVRVWQSAYDYMRTNRIRGFARLTDSNDVIAEVDASMMTLPMFRALQKEYQGEAFLPGTDQLVSDFREEIVNRMTNARTPTERMVVFEDYERRVWEALSSYYRMDAVTASELLTRYKGLRQVVTEVAKAKGFIIDDGDVNIIPDLQSLLAEGMPTMDFHFIETIFRLERGSGVRRGKDWMSLKGSRGLAAFDAIWRPLVLMRLGYTVRNVTEGGLRELAAFGTLGSMYQTGAGTRAIANNPFARWAAGFGRGMDRVASMRYGSLRNKRLNLETAASIARQNLREVKKLEERRTRVLGLVTRMADRAERNAQREIAAEARSAREARVGVTWMQVTDEAYGEMDAIMREAQEIIIPVDYIRPLMGPASRRRSNTVTGFDDQATAEGRLINEQAATDTARAEAGIGVDDANPLTVEDPANLLAQNNEINDDLVKQFLGKEERLQLDELTAAAEKIGLEDWQIQLLEELYQRATARSARAAMRNGDTVVRVVDPESGLYQVIHSPADVTADDIAEGNLSILRKENLDQVQYVRANVYGSMIDLRAKDPIGLYPYGQGRDLSIAMSDEGMVFTGSQQDLKQLHDEFLPGKEFPVLTGDKEADEKILAPIYREVRDIADLAFEDPQVRQALAIRRMAMQLPEEVRKWMEESGLLISNRKLRTLAAKIKGRSSKADKLKEDGQSLSDSIEEKMTDPDYWNDLTTDLGFDPTFHVGFRVVDDVLLPDPVDTAQNRQNLLGMGFYTTRDPEIASGYFFTRVMEPENINSGNEPVAYAIRVDPEDEVKFLDADMNGNTYENETFLREIFDDMMNDHYGRSATDDEWAEVDQVLFDRFADGAFPLGPNDPDADVGTRIGDFMFAMQHYLRSRLYADYVVDSVAKADYQSQLSWINALKNRGYFGIRHKGGNNMPNYFTEEFSAHDVFIWYGDGTKAGTPELIRLDDLSDDMVEWRNLAAEWQRTKDEIADLTKEQASLDGKVPYDPKSLNAATMSPKAKAMLAEYMRQNGVGRILLDDPMSPSGYQMLTSPDMISVSTDQVDAVLPSGLIGKDFVDNTLPQLERDAIVRNPATLQSGNLSDVELMQMFDSNRGVVNILRGTSQGTPRERALLARAMESNGYTHVQIGTPDSNTFTTVSELVGNRQTGSAYGAMFEQDLVSQRRNLILANDDRYSALEAELGELDRMILGAEDAYGNSLTESKKAADALGKRLGKRAKGKPMKSGLGTGTERFSGRGFEDFEVDGPFNPNNQGSLNASLSSAGDTVMANLYGFTDYAMMQLRKTQVTRQYRPGDQLYFQIMAEQINRAWRNDLIGMALIRGEADDQIIKTLFETKQGRAYLRDVEGFSAFKGYVDPARLTDDARADLAQLIAERRDSLNRLVPDEDLMKHLVDNEVTPDYLQAQLGWRADLPDVVGSQFVDAQRTLIRKATGNIMRVLGTIPEDALIRHPFYRARWRDEMQRQADLYASQGVTNFSEAQLNAMNQVAKRWALKQTNETLYTIQRLSTPAHIFKFVMPFFPAWASAMRFWLLRMPVEQPQNIARYAMLWNAPESAGWVYDEDGNKVQGEDNFVGRVGNKLFAGAEGDIFIRVDNPRIRKRIEQVTGYGDISIPKGSIDMMLQGETFWFPGLTPFAAIPASWLAAQTPDVATAIETGKLREIPILKDILSEDVENFISENELTRPFYRAVVPFGMPTREKDLMDIAFDYTAPAFLNRWATAIRGMGSAEFSSAAKEIHRTRMTDWELAGKEGPEPDFLDSVSQAREFYWFRGGMNLTMPFATRFHSKYKFYIDEGRRIDRETFDAGGTYEDANKEFLRLYGPTFFKFTQSLSAGGSGMSSTVGEYKEFERDPRLMASLASIGDDASFITMATRPFAQALNEDGFDGAVYSWQMNRQIEGALGKYLRGGQTTELPTTRANRELGWMYFEQGMEALNALAASRGTTVENDPSLQAVKKQLVDRIAGDYREWFEDYKEIGGNRYIQSNNALQEMVNAGYFEAHKDHPYAQALLAFYEGRKVFGQMLLAREAAGGSKNIDAKSNASVKLVYENWIEQLRSFDTTGNFGNTWERFFQSDPLLPIPGLEESNG